MSTFNASNDSSRSNPRVTLTEPTDETSLRQDPHYPTSYNQPGVPGYGDVDAYSYLGGSTSEHHASFNTQSWAPAFSSSTGNIELRGFGTSFDTGSFGVEFQTHGFIGNNNPSSSLEYPATSTFGGYNCLCLPGTQYLGSIGNQDFGGLNNLSFIPTGASEVQSGPSNCMDWDSTQSTHQGTLNDGIAVIPTTSETIVQDNRFVCSHSSCSKTFSRFRDCRRHMEKQHGPPQHDCSSGNCNRKGLNGFRRADKLREHQRKIHGLAV